MAAEALYFFRNTRPPVPGASMTSKPLARNHSSASSYVFVFSFLGMSFSFGRHRPPFRGGTHRLAVTPVIFLRESALVERRSARSNVAHGPAGQQAASAGLVAEEG